MYVYVATQLPLQCTAAQAVCGTRVCRVALSDEKLRTSSYVCLLVGCATLARARGNGISMWRMRACLQLTLTLHAQGHWYCDSWHWPGPFRGTHDSNHGHGAQQSKCNLDMSKLYAWYMQIRQFAAITCGHGCGSRCACTVQRDLLAQHGGDTVGSSLTVHQMPCRLKHHKGTSLCWCRTQCLRQQ